MKSVFDGRIVEVIRGAIKDHGYTQEKMGKVLGLAPSTFNLKINGKNEFTLSECAKIAQALGTTLDELFLDVPKSKAVSTS